MDTCYKCGKLKEADEVIRDHEDGGYLCEWCVTKMSIYIAELDAFFGQFPRDSAGKPIPCGLMNHRYWIAATTDTEECGGYEVGAHEVRVCVYHGDGEFTVRREKDESACAWDGPIYATKVEAEAALRADGCRLCKRVGWISAHETPEDWDDELAEEAGNA